MLVYFLGWLALLPESPKLDEGKSKQPQGIGTIQSRLTPSKAGVRKNRASVSGAHQVQYLFILLALVNRIR